MPKTYYELFMLPAKAVPLEIRATFRRYVARFRPLLTVPQLMGDRHFQQALNAYLVLSGPLRSQYDALLQHGVDTPLPPQLTGIFDALSETERNLIVARIATWRREMMEATHLLRLTMENHPDCAAAWALMGEIHLTFGRYADAVRSYQRAVNLDVNNPEYTKRLSHIEQAMDGIVELELESSPEEELLREERKRRWRFTALLCVFGIIVLLYAFISHVKTTPDNFLGIPWQTVWLQAIGVMLLLAGLAYGRILRPFEQEMVWNTMSAVEQGTPKNYPLGLILLVLSVASLWLAVVGFVVIALMEDDWPYSPLIMLGVAAVVNIGLAILLGVHHSPNVPALIFGGNLLCLGGIIGWWVGSFGISSS